MRMGTKTTITQKYVIPVEENEKEDSYYEIDGLPECKELIEGILDSYSENKVLEPGKLFYLGNVIKYLYRAPKKGGLDDLKKAHEYLSWILKNKDS